MKRTALTVFASLAFALAACSSTTTTDGGSGGGTSSGGTTGGTAPGDGGISITLSSIGIAPEAVAALAALPKPVTPPSLANGYQVILQAVTLSGTSAKLTDVGAVKLDSSNDTGPITFSHLSFAGGIAALGVISAVIPQADGGLLNDAGTVGAGWPSCSDLYGDGGGPGINEDGGFQDYLVVAASQVHFGPPTGDIANGVSYAIPASYAALLDCAAGQAPGTFVNGGMALAYVSSQAAGGGTPVSGVTLSGNIAANQLYYAAGYGAGSATATPPTSSNGVVSVTNNGQPSTFSAKDSSGTTYGSLDLATAQGSIYQVFYSPGL